ncbi:hypothetical protein I6E61_10020 [Psychrobacter sp. NZS113]|uniref:hypothetical protein n=1 Tax=Psychrobacter sp. NZS113 TaxID=2792045 RepID=UPI0018CD1A1E|nr:hypothetical protein [Psychrobacter sp. NZS113]MBH0096720.1 hypothetical protein [Psychrobacter sp. NZS113]
MNQTFDLHIANETIASDAQQLGVTVDDLKRICVQVSAHIVKYPKVCLQLTYHITLPNQMLADKLDWPTWQPERVGFADYLWEETCLECFITGNTINSNTVTNDTTSYVEINANPDGRYALYQFESYRNPATLPPSPLYQADGHTRASIEWINKPKPHSTSANTHLLRAPDPLKPNSYKYELSFNVSLTQLSDTHLKYAINNTIIEQIHPCVILWLDKTPLYYATSHASPPDFHNRQYWSRFEL